MLRPRVVCATALTGLIAGLLAAIPAAALVTGTLDPTFASGGIGTLDLSRPSIDVAHAALPGVTGGPLLVGSAGGRFALGILTSGFGNARGQVIVDFDRPAAAFAVTGNGGGMTVAGHAGDDFAVVRLDHAGAPDIYFGDLGRVRTSFGRPAVARGVAGGARGILVAGTVGEGAGADVALARYDVRGALDPTYGRGGTVVDDVSGGADAANAVAGFSSPELPSRGMVAGRAGGAVLVARYLASGAPDPSYGVAGRALLDLTPGDDVAHALAVRPDGGVVVSGTAGAVAFVARLTPAGLLDPSFGSGGVVTIDLGPGNGLTSVYHSNGSDKVVAAGTVTGSAGTDGVAVRLNADGRFDSGFGVNGRAVVDLGGPADRANAMLLTEPFVSGDNGLQLIGGDGSDMRIVQLDPVGRPGTLPGGATGRIDFSTSAEQGSAMAVQPDGAIVVAGAGDPGLVLTRFRPDGRLDRGFGRDGVAVEPLGQGTDVALQGDGKILVAGSRAGRGGGVYRFLNDGRIDDSFGSAGFGVVGGPPAGAVAVRPDGHIVVGAAGLTVLSPSGQVKTVVDLGYSRRISGLAVEPGGGVVAVMGQDYPLSQGGSATRLHPDGTVDTAFRGGMSSLIPGRVVRMGDGRLVVAGHVVPNPSGGVSQPTDLGLIALKPDGMPDESFGGPGTGGVVKIDVDRYDYATDVALTPDDKILVSFSYSSDGPTSRLGVARYLANGRLDATFGGGGTWISPLPFAARAVAAGPNGRILVAGTIGGDPDFDVVVVGIASRAVAAGRPRAWGFDGLGQLSLGSGPVIGIAGGIYHSLTVAADGTAWASGWNGTGQLGDGTTVDSKVPVKVAGLTGVVAVAGGAYHSIALRSDGTVWAWGWNPLGQLGNGTRLDSRTPVQVAGLTQVTAITAGFLHNLALRADGSVWAWGWNGFGQLGTGSTADSLAPARVSLPAPVAAVAAGYYHSLFVSGAGSVLSVGWNGYGQLGQESESLTPTAVYAGVVNRSPFVAVAGGGLHSLAVRADGTVWSWGWNAVGQLGDGSRVDSRTPVMVKGLTNTGTVAAGSYHSMALGRDGIVRTWGWGAYGQLGVDAAPDRTVPAAVTAVPAGTTLNGIAAGHLHSLAY